MVKSFGEINHRGHRVHGVAKPGTLSDHSLCSDSVYSVHSVVTNSGRINHRGHRIHGVKRPGTLSDYSRWSDSVYSVYSVQSVVKSFGEINHRGHKVHRVGKALGMMHEPFGERMDPLIADLNMELPA
jgi:hypothetical protein